MKTKSLLIVVAALAILAAIITLLTRRPQSQAYETAGQPVLPRNITTQTAQIEITEKNSNTPITLQKKDGGLWLITSYHNAPANLTRIAKLTDDLEASKIQRIVTANPERFERLGLGARTVTFRDSEKKEIFKISFGETSQEGGYFLKLENNNSAFEAHPQVFFTANPDEWLARELFQFKIEDITALNFQLSGDRQARFQRDEQGKWQLLEPQIPDGRSLKKDMPESILRLLLNTNIYQHNLITDPTSQAALANARLVEFTLKDGQKISLKIGRAPSTEDTEQNSTPVPTNPVLIFLQSAPEAYVWSEAARTIIPHASETLLKQIPTSIEDMLDSPTAEEMAEQQPLIPPAPAD
jgi:hypothetical protein